jgi:hypothetical protein
VAGWGDDVKHTFQVGLAAIVLAGSMACSNNSTTAPSSLTSTTSNRGTFNVSVRPSPITATHCAAGCSGQSGSGSFAFSADLTIDVQDSAGVGATVNSITLTWTADGMTLAPLALSGDDIRGMAGTNHVDDRATLSIPLTVVYNTPSGKANLSISVSVQITDERSNQLTASGQASVI